jgi:nitrite reductase/ring-hydroxylating ferredoxin subunit
MHSRFRGPFGYSPALEDSKRSSPNRQKPIRWQQRTSKNERLTRIGPGTPMGSLLRHYWQVVAAVRELDTDPVRRIRLLGENLTLYRSESSEYGLIGDRCPYGCMEMSFGIPHADGLRCAHRGWLFNAEGKCLEMPFEDRTHPEARFREKVKAYPVAELGGLIFAYLGPLPAPPLPRWDLLARDDLDVAAVYGQRRRPRSLRVAPCELRQLPAEEARFAAGPQRAAGRVVGLMKSRASKRSGITW